MKVVHKYGGSSVATLGQITAVAERVAALRREGHHIAVVASAMGKATDALKAMADAVGGADSPRELDALLATGELQTVALLALAIERAGVPAVSLSGAQCGLLTTSHHTRARIRSIDCRRVLQAVAQGAVPVVAGFQGADAQGNVTTLGRGGSDTTAVALAAALGWDCEIYTDVDGVFAADPRKTPGARRLSRISYDEMMELASLGAGVLETRSVELAKKYRVGLFLGRALETDKGKGTYIMETRDFEDMPVAGVSAAGDRAVLSARGPDGGAWVGRLLQLAAGLDISLDTIAMQHGADGQCALTLCCARADARQLAEAAEGRELPARLEIRDGLSRVSLVGAGMIARSGVAAKAFALLAQAGVACDHVTTSEIAISLTIDSRDEGRAVLLLAQGFGLCAEAAGAEALAAAPAAK